MWGENILVAPVLQKGVTKRNIYLPKGKWYNPNGKMYDGNQWIEMEVPLKDISYFFREGSIVPTQASLLANTASTNNNSIAFTYVPSTMSTTYNLYSDDGISKNSLATNNYKLTNIQAQQTNDTQISITIKNSKSPAKAYQNKEVFISIPLQQKPNAVSINNKTYSVLKASQSNNTRSIFWMTNNVLMINSGTYDNKLKIVVSLK